MEVAHVMEIMTGIPKARVMYLLTRLRLFDTLRLGETQSLDQLAGALKVDRQILRRLLRYGAQFGLVKESTDNTYSVTEMGAVLAHDHPSKICGVVEIWNMNAHWKGYEALYQGITTGKQPLAVAFNTPDSEPANCFTIMKQDPYEEHAFEDAMVGVTHAGLATVMQYREWDKYESIADVGGNTGTVVRKVLAEYPSIKRGYNCDLDFVLADCPPPEPGLEGRLINVQTDFFTTIPQEVHGVGAIVLKHILHDWGFDKCVLILKNCAKALGPGGHILIIDHIIPETAGVAAGTLPSWPFAMDITMMAVTDGGCERTMAEWTEMCAAAGLSAPEVVASHHALAMLRCLPQ